MMELAIEGMTCAACAQRIETALNRVPGVTATVNFAAEKARVTYPPGGVDSATLVAAVRRAGYDAHEIISGSRSAEKARQTAIYRRELRLFWVSSALTLPFVAQMIFMFGGHERDLLPFWLQLGLATPVQFWIGKRFYAGAWHALRAGGAYAGHQIEKHVKSSKTYEVVVRMEDGGSRRFSQETQPAFRVGDRVKVVEGALVPN